MDLSFKDYFLLNEGKEKNFCYILYAEKPYDSYLKEIQDELDLDGELTEKDKFHCTVRCVVTPKDPAPFIDYLTDVPLPKISATTKNFELFGPDEEKCLVMELESKKMHDWFQQVNKFLIDSEYPDSDYPTYKPHITFTRGTEQEKPEFKPKKHRLKVDFTKHIVTDENYDIILEKKAE